MGKKKECVKAPRLKNGKESKTYIDLYKMLKDKKSANPQQARQMANVMYASYVANKDIADTLDINGKKRNSQDQHTAEDIYEILGGDDLVKYYNPVDLNDFMITNGVMLNTSVYQDFDNYKDAYTLATDINQNNPMLSAFVIRQGDKYQIRVSPKNSSNMIARVTTQIEHDQMERRESTMSNHGLDIGRLSEFQDTYFGSRYEDLVKWLRDMPKIMSSNPDLPLKRDWKMMVSLYESDSIIQRLIRRYGDLDSVANTIYDYFKGHITVSRSDEMRLLAAVDMMKSLNGLDGEDLYDKSKDLTKNIKDNSPDYAAQKAFDKLNDAFKIAQEGMKTTAEDLNTILDVIKHSIFTLGVHSDSMKGDKAKEIDFEELKNLKGVLSNELKNKVYLNGLAEMLLSLTRRFQALLPELQTNIPKDADLPFVLSMGNKFMEAKRLLYIYAPIVESLTNAEDLARDISVSDSVVGNLQRQALALNKILNNIKRSITNGVQIWERQTLSAMMGDSDNITIDEVMTTASKDPSFIYRLFNPATVSNIPIAVLSAFLARERNARAPRLSAANKRVYDVINKLGGLRKYSKLNKKLFEKVNGVYMIQSEYDWGTYYKKRRKFIIDKKRNGLTGIDLETAIERWELLNTDEVFLPGSTTETHRVPKFKKDDADNPFLNGELSASEIDAYNEFMEFKAAYEALLPPEARNLYEPIQIRKSSIDYLGEGKVGKALLEQYEDRFKERLGEEDYAVFATPTDDGGAILSTRETDITGEGRRIPVQFKGRLKNQEELNLNIAEQLMHLAATAINYDSMSRIQDSIELLSDCITRHISAEKDGYTLAQTFTQGGQLFYKPLTKKGKSASKILNDVKDRLMYNDNTLGRGVKGAKKLAFVKYVTSVIALTTNLFGAINNANEGVRMNLIGAFTPGTGYNIWDLTVAWKRIWTNNVACAPIHIVDYFTGKKSTMTSLVHEYFDPKRTKFHELTNKKYRTNFFRKALSTDLTFILYGVGETLNNMPLVEARLNHVKVLVNGKKRSLRHAFDKKKSKRAGTLVLKDDVVFADTGQKVLMSDLEKIKAEIQSISETHHGGMAAETQGQIASTVLGAMTLQLRRWMIGVYSAYFRGTYYDAFSGKYKTGAYKGMFNVLVNKNPIIKAIIENDKHMPWSKEFAEDIKTFGQDIIKNWNNLNKGEKEGAGRFLVTTVVMAILSQLCDAMVRGLYPKHRDEWWFKILYYILMRQKMDTGSVVPDVTHIERIFDIPANLLTIAKSPYTSVTPFERVIKIGVDIRHIGEKVENKKSPYYEQDKFLASLHQNLLPHVNTKRRIESLFTPGDNTLLESLSFIPKFSIDKEYERLTGKEAPKRKKSFEEMMKEKQEEYQKKLENMDEEMEKRRKKAEEKLSGFFGESDFDSEEDNEDNEEDNEE